MRHEARDDEVIAAATRRAVEEAGVAPAQRGRTGTVNYNPSLHPHGAGGRFAETSGGARPAPTQGAVQAQMQKEAGEVKAYEAKKAKSERSKGRSKATKAQRKAEAAQRKKETAANRAEAAQRRTAKTGEGQAWTGKLSTTEDLKPGMGHKDASPAVGLLQSKLQALGFGVGKVDGKYGPETTTGVKVLQREYGLKPTGTVEASTLQVIETLVARSQKFAKAGIIESQLLAGESVATFTRTLLAG